MPFAMSLLFSVKLTDAKPEVGTSLNKEFAALVTSAKTELDEEITAA
jgi:hypothetical protein